MDFKLVSDYAPMGDQPEAIEQLVGSIRHGSKHNTLLGVTGSGKTFTVANVVAQLNRPTLVLSHNKTLAAQLYGEFRNFFPENAVEYFVSYYDYYQPEAYLPSTDTYIEKDLSINAEIEKLRLRTVATLLSGRRDVIVVSSVSCLYGAGNPADFHATAIDIKVGQIVSYKHFLYKLVEALYTRTERELEPATFRVNGDTVVILYLMTIPTLAMILGGSASGSPFAGVGSSRTMVAIMSYELPLILIFLAVGRAATAGMGVTFSLGQITLAQYLLDPFILDWRLIPAAIAMLLVVPCEVGQQPFDVGEAETEICEGPLVEYSGAPLAVFKLSHAVKMFVMTALFCALFLGGITTGMLWLDVIITLAFCTVVTLVCMSLLHAITARFRVEQLFKFFWTVVSGLALISLLLVWFC